MAEIKSITLGTRIKTLRLSKGLTQGELARGEITPGLISQIESDRVAPSVRVIALLAEQLGVDPTDLTVEVETRNSQFQMFKEAKELLEGGRAAQAYALLSELSSAQVSYIPTTELKLETAYAKEQLGEDVQARQMYEEVEHETFLAGDHVLGAACMNRQGDYYMRTGRIALALFAYRKALSFLQSAGGAATQTASAALKNMCVCAYRLGDTDQAVQYAERALSETGSGGPSADLAEILHILSVLKVERDRSEALKLAADSVAMYRSLGGESQLIDAKMNQAIVQRELGDFRSALRALPGIIAEYYAQGRQQELANAWTERATCEILAEQYEDAARSLERSFAIAHPDTVELAETLRVRAQLDEAVGDRKKAVATFERSASLLLSLDLVHTGLSVFRRLKELYVQAGDSVNALRAEEKICELSARIEQKKRVAAVLS